MDEPETWILKEKIMRQTLVAKVENKPGVLNRVASLFRRRNFNIDSLNVGRTEDPSLSRMTIVVDSQDTEARLVEANLYKLVNVVDVQDVTNQSALLRELAQLLGYLRVYFPQVSYNLKNLMLEHTDQWPRYYNSSLCPSIFTISQNKPSLPPRYLASAARLSSPRWMVPLKPPPASRET